MSRTPIAYAVATVKFPLYEGDTTSNDFSNWFEYREPGISKDGNLGVCTRKCEVVGPTTIEWVEDKKTA